jgi:hypothetical protein
LTTIAELLSSAWTWFWVGDVVALAVLLGVRVVLVRTALLRGTSAGKSSSLVIAWVMITAIAAGFFGISNNSQLQQAKTTDAALLVALGLFALGILVGFLFALPKVADAAAPKVDDAHLPARLRANTNLEKVSDWLTTVITGLALTQLTSVPGYLDRFAVFLAGGLAGNPLVSPGGTVPTGAKTIPDASLVASALGIAIEFPIVGFLAGYIATRTVLTSAFEDAERSLFGDTEREKVDAQPKLLQIPDPSSDTGPSEDELAAARTIASAPVDTLTTADEQATYARALTILGRARDALPWFQRALGVTPNDSRLLEQYAAALYNSTDSDPPAGQMLPVLQRALRNVKDDPAARARISTNLVLTYLYLPDGFVKALALADDIDHDTTLEKRPLLFYYRACAYGQLYTALISGRTFPEPTPNDKTVVGEKIYADTHLALRMQPALRKRFANVIVKKPVDPNRVAPNDDDLATFAHDHPHYKDLIDKG